MSAVQQVLAGYNGKRRYATWDPDYKGANIVLADGNLKASQVGGEGFVRSNIGKTSGKWYFEVTSGSSSAIIGCANDLEPSTASGCGVSGNNSIGYYSTDGKIYRNNIVLYSGATYGAGDVIGFTIDADNRLFRFYKNGVFQTEQSLASGVTFYAACGTPASNVVHGTANFGESPFIYSVPSGYNSGIYD